MKRFNRQKGFTVIELIVAIPLFAILVAVASVTFIQSLKTQRNVVALAAANDNAIQLIEQMSGEIRTGIIYAPETTNGLGEDELFLSNSEGQLVIYRLRDEAIEKVTDTTVRKVTAGNVRARDMKFFYKGTNRGDGFPPRITLFLTLLGPNDIPMYFQTTVSARTIGT